MLYPSSNLLNPKHKIKVVLVGCGGTGSRVLVELSALSQNLVEMDHLGFEIHVFDPDTVEQHNIGRQQFYQTDLHESKSQVLATRVNRSYGDNIISYFKYCEEKELTDIDPDIIITCVDNVGFRKSLDKILFNWRNNNLIWIDTGNDKNSGQVIMSMYQYNEKITPNCVDLFPDMIDQENVPSCSTKAALKKQSFNINKFIANFTIQFLTNIFIDFQIPYTQLYFSLTKLKIKTK
jgi:PRTRC genetic system ThiF family protein